MLRTRLNEILAGSALDARSDEEFVREALRSVCAYMQIRPGTIDEPGS